jgi:hypothetical protein
MAMEAHAIAEENPFAAADEQFDALKSKLQATGTWKMEHSELETLIETEGRELMRRLLQDHLNLRAKQEQEHGVLDEVAGSDGVARTHHRDTERGLMTIFGPVRERRIAYGARGAESLHPMDAALNVPIELFSHGVRRRVAQEVARSSFDGALDAVRNTTGAQIAKRQLEEVAIRAAADFDEFYRTREKVSLLEEATSGPLLIVTVDGKGIVMRPEHLRDATRKAAEARSHKLSKRVSRGEKKNAKRMATVAAVYTLPPYARIPEDIVGELAGVSDADVTARRPRPEHKRVWASVADEMPDVIGSAFDEGCRRDPARMKRWVALVDGNKTQMRLLQREAKRRGIELTMVLDIIHVIEYLWRAAWCFFSEGDAAIETWVAERLGRVLRGEVSHVAAGIRRSATKRKLSPQERKGADVCARYLLTYKKLMRYDRYLADGLPIATGVIEGACRHIVGDRMDITGARWGLDGAEAVLHLRSLIASGDFDEYWRFHLAQQKLLNHTMRYANDAPRLRPPPAPESKRSASRPTHLRLVK